MNDITINSSTISDDDSQQSSRVPRISIFALGMSLSIFLAITYVICVIFDLWFPHYAMNPVWGPLLPGFVWLSWPSFFLGLAETAAYGWFIACIFGPLYNFFSARYR